MLEKIKIYLGLTDVEKDAWYYKAVKYVYENKSKIHFIFITTIHNEDTLNQMHCRLSNVINIKTIGNTGKKYRPCTPSISMLVTGVQTNSMAVNTIKDTESAHMRNPK